MKKKTTHRRKDDMNEIEQKRRQIAVLDEKFKTWNARVEHHSEKNHWYEVGYLAGQIVLLTEQIAELEVSAGRMK